jgi:hypothetical protein
VNGGMTLACDHDAAYRPSTCHTHLSIIAFRFLSRTSNSNRMAASSSKGYLPSIEWRARSYGGTVAVCVGACGWVHVCVACTVS